MRIVLLTPKAGEGCWTFHTGTVLWIMDGIIGFVVSILGFGISFEYDSETAKGKAA